MCLKIKPSFYEAILKKGHIWSNLLMEICATLNVIFF